MSSSGNQERQKDFDAVSTEGHKLSEAIATVKKKEKQLDSLRTEIVNFSTTIAAKHTEWKARYSDVLDESAWKAIRPDFATTPDSVLDDRLAALETERTKLEADGIPVVDGNTKRRGLAEIRLEYERLRKLIGLDEANAQKRNQLNERGSTLEAQIKKIQDILDDAEKGTSRIEAARTTRMSAYKATLSAVTKEIQVLERLYAPLSEALQQDPRLNRLSSDPAITAWADTACHRRQESSRRAPLRPQAGHSQNEFPFVRRDAERRHSGNLSPAHPGRAPQSAHSR